MFIDVHRDWYHTADDPGLYWVLKNCQNSISRWKTLTVTRGVATPYDDMGMTAPTVESVIKLLHRSAQLSCLHELHIYNEDDSSSSSFSPSWTFPNLRLLRCVRYLPLPSAALFSSVSTFSSVQLLSKTYPSQAQGLLSFLAATPSISSFELEIKEESAGVAAREPLQFPGLVCPSIKSFHLRLPTLQISDRQVQIWQQFIAPLIQALWMPCLEDLTMSLHLCASAVGADANIMTFFSYASLPACVADPRSSRTSLNYKIKERPSYTQANIPMVFVIPLSRIPTVSSLNISTYTPVYFVHGSEGDTSNGAQLYTYSLRDLRFAGCENIGIEHFQWSIQALKDTGAWESIERVTVEGCRHLGREDVLEVVGEERLYYSP